MDELKPCPFCGTQAVIGTSRRNHVSVYWVYCLKCRARSDQWFFKEKATEMWNRRVKTAKKKTKKDDCIQHVGYTPEQMGYDK